MLSKMSRISEAIQESSKYFSWKTSSWAILLLISAHALPTVWQRNMILGSWHKACLMWFLLHTIPICFLLIRSAQNCLNWSECVPFHEQVIAWILRMSCKWPVAIFRYQWSCMLRVYWIILDCVSLQSHIDRLLRSRNRHLELLWSFKRLTRGLGLSGLPACQTHSYPARSAKWDTSWHRVSLRFWLSGFNGLFQLKEQLANPLFAYFSFVL